MQHPVAKKRKKEKKNRRSKKKHEVLKDTETHTHKRKWAIVVFKDRLIKN